MRRMLENTFSAQLAQGALRRMRRIRRGGIRGRARAQALVQNGGLGPSGYLLTLTTSRRTAQGRGRESSTRPERPELAGDRKKAWSPPLHGGNL